MYARRPAFKSWIHLHLPFTTKLLLYKFGSDFYWFRFFVGKEEATELMMEVEVLKTERNDYPEQQVGNEGSMTFYSFLSWVRRRQSLRQENTLSQVISRWSILLEMETYFSFSFINSLKETLMTKGSRSWWWCRCRDIVPTEQRTLMLFFPPLFHLLFLIINSSP